MKIGIIADDFTGATDVAGFLVSHGVRTIQILGVPQSDYSIEADAYVISLKSRSCPAKDAVEMSLASLKWLREHGCTIIYFKYCSTFDSTGEGNIGPVADAVIEALDVKSTVVCPSLPVNGRTVYQGYLFVYDKLLNESGMENHPLTPMKDAKIRRLLQSQTSNMIGEIGTVDIDKGPDEVRGKINRLSARGCRYIVLDTLNNTHLDCIADAVSDFTFFTGGSGLAAAIARRWKKDQNPEEKTGAAFLPPGGKTVIIAGSCSLMTNTQVKRYSRIGASYSIDTEEVLNNPEYVNIVTSWTEEHLEDSYAPMVFATKSPEQLSMSKQKYGDARTGERIESFFGSLGKNLAAMGVKNFIIAGGETAGSVVQALSLQAFYIGSQIDPGVPWVKAVDREIYLALKSGNFGSEDFFQKAQEKKDG